MMRSLRAAALFAAIIMGSYYHWQVRAAGYDIVWAADQPGYYNQLAQGFAAGHLYLTREPLPELLALPNPWDPKVDDALRMHDAVLFNRHYYIYHGAGPAVMAFLPWLLITHHDLPENAAIFAFGFLGYLFSAGALLGLLELAKVRPNPFAGFLAFLALGACQCLPMLLNRVWVYEVAIVAGYFCVSAGIYFLVRHFVSGKNSLLIPAGFFFGMAIACRPHMGIIGALALLLVAVRKPGRNTLRFGLPFALLCLSVCWYNYQRFGKPFEFGTTYLMAEENQSEVHWRTGNLKHGLFFLMGIPPKVSPVFPWFHAASRTPDVPRAYIVEPIIGGIFLAPFLVLMLLGVRAGPARQMLLLLAASGVGAVLFIAGTGWSVQRYQGDFLPLFALCALLCGLARLPGVVTVLLILPGLVVSLALGITGPYNEMLHNRPLRYVRMAGWFSPVEKHRPLLNPAIDRAWERDELRPEGTRDVLLILGPGAAVYQLRFEQALGKPTLVSEYWAVGLLKAEAVLPPSNGPRRLRAVYDPATNTINVEQNGALVLSHKVGPLVTAPSELRAAPTRF